MSETAGLHLRWLGEVDYAQAWAVQTAMFANQHNHLLLCSHPPVYTFGRRAKQAHMLQDPAEIGAEQFRVDRGGDVTFHGPGQLVGYPILNVAGKRGGGMADTRAYVASIEDLIIGVLDDLGLEGGRLAEAPGVWVDAHGVRPRKIAAIGVRLSRGRSMHGFGLNVNTDLSWFSHIVPCGIEDKGVTSLAAEGIDVTMAEVVDLVAARAGDLIGGKAAVARQDVVWSQSGSERPMLEANQPDQAGVSVQLSSRMKQAGLEPGSGLSISERKPSWMRVKLETGPEYRRMRKLTSDLDLATVCEDAGCPNIYECWNEGTATFMLLGHRCTRACAFCLIDTRKPDAPDPAEPERIADAVNKLGLDYAVLTMVARDDLVDGGAAHVASTIRRLKQSSPTVGVEVLISDLGGSEANLAMVIDAKPDVVNHNIETVARLQRAVRPAAGYVSSLSVLARAKSSGLITKSGLIVGMGESVEEVRGALVDLAGVGVDLVTIGQYLRPTERHIPVSRWWTESELSELKKFGEQELGITHVEASPLTRSSHHAATGARKAGWGSIRGSAVVVHQA